MTKKSDTSKSELQVTEPDSPKFEVVMTTGGRKYEERERVFEVMDQIHAHREIDIVINGDCQQYRRRGADWYVREWAYSRKVVYMSVPMDFKRYGKPAGPIRNSAMFNYFPVRELIAFPGGAGTKDTVDKAKRKGISVLEIPEERRRK